MKILLRSFFIVYLLSGFSFSLPAQKKNQTYLNYINKYSNTAEKHRDQYKIPASITLAQGIIESSAGTSGLARESNNHFGIKCHADWTGGRVYRKDDGPNDCFRKYNSVADSYEDHAKFLRQYPRYTFLFSYDVKNYKAWARGLQTAGYATDKGYAGKLITLIEAYELYRFDAKGSKKTPKPSTEKNKKPELLRAVYRGNGLLYIIAKDEDSFEQIAAETGFKAKDLSKYNEMPENYPFIDGDIVYLQKKKNKADLPNFEHIVKMGESMHIIAQRYGIRVNNLYKLNKKNKEFVPTEGEVLRLR